jgi:hypothetical protein
MVLLWNVHVQEPIHAIHTSLSCVNFFWEDVKRHYIRPTNRSLRWVEHGVKNNHAMSCDAENRGHLRILRRFSKETELRSIASP